MIIAIVVASVFVFMSLSFTTYDWFVQQRNDKVVDAAVRSGAIVSSLFPSTVRERLYKEAEENQVKAKQLESRNTLQKWTRIERDDDNIMRADNQCIPYKAKPIADLFPATTVRNRILASATMFGFH